MKEKHGTETTEQYSPRLKKLMWSLCRVRVFNFSAGDKSNNAHHHADHQPDQNRLVNHPFKGADMDYDL